MAILMQAFYWDCPRHEGKDHEWWNFVASKVPELSASGINALWLPPISKGFNDITMGYDPYDYWDLGDYNQRGGTKTWFGNRAELEALIKTAREHNIGCYADMVLNHNSGADEEEVNPLDGQKRWTKFNPQSGKFPRNWNCFYPSRYEEIIVEGENYAGYPNLCHRNPVVYAAMYDWARFVIEDLGFTGFRFDFVKGFASWMISQLAKYRYVQNGQDIRPYVVGEFWGGDQDIETWIERVNSVTDNQIAAFDFPLRYKLKDVCDTPNYDLRNLTQGGTVVMRRPAHAVTFVDNHDMGDNAIVYDKMIAYSFIMVHEGYPCIFWYDYFNNQLARPRTPNGIDALIHAHQLYAGGDSQILWADQNLYIMQRLGYKDDNIDQPGLVYVLNSRSDEWQGATVQTQWKNTKFKPIAWDGHDEKQPEERTTNAEGQAEFPAPPRGYCVYVPVFE
ncbi:MAG: DUF1939 domain-containing protein [Acidobacteriaceae bacterium]|nr:DUF1939 domain-containing protein [Acidobacteriaceae bacterium]